MAVLFPGKFIYVATPHTATISTTHALARLPGAIPSSLNEIVDHLPEHRLARRTHHSTKQEVQELHPDYFTGTEQSVSVVRNPYDLVLTWWLRQRGAVEKRTGHEPSFQEFLETYDERGPGPYLRGDRMFWMDADHELRYESLQDELNAFLGRHGLGPVELPHLNVTGKTGPWRSYYDAEAFRTVNRRFGDEIQTKGYPLIDD